jgi:hypothetical protein
MKLLLSLYLSLALLLSVSAASADLAPGVRTFRSPSVYVTSTHQWVVDRMLTWMPPGQSKVKMASETAEEGKARYEEIADDLISVVFDPSERPVFSGSYGRAKTLAIMLSVSWFESGFRKDVDLGLGGLARGDSGQSWCLMQVKLGKEEKALENTKQRIVLDGDYFKFTTDRSAGFGGKDLVRDRKACFRTGLHLIRNSFDRGAGLPVLDRLSIYASGKAIRDFDVSRVRVKRAQAWLSQELPPLEDKAVMDILHPPEEELLPVTGDPGLKPPGASGNVG